MKLINLLLLMSVGAIAGFAAPKFLLPSKAKPDVDVRSLVITQIQNSTELTTTTYMAEVVVPVKQSRKVGSFLFKGGIEVGIASNVLYVAHGQVRAGVDLGEIQPDNVQATEQGVKVQLPAAKILDSKIDVAKSQAYSSDPGLLGLGPDTAQLQTVAEREALQRVTQAACDGGILQQASDRAAVVVQKLMEQTGSSITVEVQKSTQCGG